MTDNDFNLPTIEPGTYRHYKNKLYYVVGIAVHSETHKVVVVYKPLYESIAEYWVRPYDMFIEDVNVDGKTIPRFERIGD